MVEDDVMVIEVVEAGMEWFCVTRRRMYVRSGGLKEHIYRSGWRVRSLVAGSGKSGSDALFVTL